MFRQSAFLLTTFLCICGVGAESLGWRGDGSGKYLSVTPPTDWGINRHVRWKTPLPSWSNATPVVVGDRVFVCAEPDTLLCLQADTGEILWQHANGYGELPDFADPTAMAEANKKATELRRQLSQLQGKIWGLRQALKNKPEDEELKAQLQAAQEELKGLRQKLAEAAQAPYVLPATHEVNGYSSPTPVSDGQFVYVLFGHGVAACYDLEGRRRWIRYIERPQHEYGHSSSPLLVNGKLIVHILHLMALDPATGQTLWQIRLPESWGTPQAGCLADGTTIIATAAGDIVRASDGHLLARSLCRLEYGDPILAEGVVYYMQNGGKAFRLSASAAEPFSPQLLWETQIRKDRYYAGCVLHEGLIYAVTQAGIWSVVEASSGQIVYEQNLGLRPTIFPSVTLADGILYVSNDKGDTILIRPGRQYEEIGRCALEPFRASLVFVGKRMYVRTLTSLFCIEQTD